MADTIFDLQNRIDCLALLLNKISNRCSAASSVIEVAAEHDGEFVAVSMLREVGWMADRAQALTGGVAIFGDADAWMLGADTAKSVKQAEAINHG